jgi:hypothetical protein
MLCCALGITAVATMPAWRRVLRTAAGPFRSRTVAVISFSIIATALVGILAAHSFFHRGADGQAQAMSHLCIAPSLRTAEFRMAGRVAPNGQSF